MRQVFTHIFETGHWQGPSSVSGAGSDQSQTAGISRALPDLVRAYGIESVLDLPCGDFHWMQRVELGGATYIGADIVEPLVRQN
jgi:hypothetical protein